MELLIAAVAIVLALIAMSKGSGYDTRIAQLKLRLGKLEEELAGLRAGGTIAEAPVAEPPKRVAFVAKEDLPPPEPAELEHAALAAAPEVAVESAPAAAAAAAAAKAAGPDMEQRVATRWFVWLGGAAIAIGGLLFVKYAYDVGLISPTLQIILGLAIGAGLVAAGEMVRKRLGEGAAKSFVPAALSAAGIAIAFGSVLAAYTLYNIIGPTPAFIGLGAIALAALALSLRQGPLIAALGVAGSYITPMLISSPDPSAASFFPYVAIVQAACFAILRKRPWWWLGYVGVAGSLLWVQLWLNGPYEAADLWPIGLFAFVAAAIALFAVEGRAILKAASGSLINPAAMSHALRIATAGVGAAAIMLSALVFTSGHQNAAVWLFVAFMLAVAAISWFKEEETLAAPIAGAATLLVLAGWQQASLVTLAMDEQGFWSSVPGPHATSYLRWMLAAAAAFTALGAAGMLRRIFTLPWALLAAGSGLAGLFLAWARVDTLLSQNVWALMGIAVAALLVGLHWKRQGDVDDLSSGILAAGAAGLALFAADRLLDGVWYTIAIAALAAVFAWWGTRSQTSWLGPIASFFGSLATLRLFIARELWTEDKTLPLGSHWPLYGYGVPALLLWQGARWLRKSGREPFAVALEGLSLGLAISLVSLELRVLIAGNIKVDEPQFLEMAAHIVAWLGAAYGLMYRQRLYSSLVSLWGARILLVASLAAIVFFSFGVLNPLFTNEPVPGMSCSTHCCSPTSRQPVLAFIALRSEALGSANLRMPLGLVTLFLAMTYVTMQTKRVFQGRLMELASFSNAESYAYSAVWLVCALLLFASGCASTGNISAMRASASWRWWSARCSCSTCRDWKGFTA